MTTQTPRSRVARVQRPYCLQCYAPMSRSHDACAECPSCGAQNLRIDQDNYWSREPWLRRLELCGKTGVALLVGWMTYVALFAFQTSFGVAQGMAIGAPILVGIVLWDTVSKLTRSNPYFNAGLFWSILPLLVGAPILLLGVTLCTRVLQAWPPERRIDHQNARVALAVLLTGLFLVGFALTSRLLGRRARAWQLRRVAMKQERFVRDERTGRYPVRS